jgi:hypothetical protein
MLAGGCADRAERPSGTGAEESVRSFYEALRREDWGAAYAVLHSDSRARLSAEHFARRARSYRSGLGFVPEAVQVRSCEEQDAQAVAHVVWTGQAAGKRRTYADGVALRRVAAGWRVVLPRRFGQARS